MTLMTKRGALTSVAALGLLAVAGYARGDVTGVINGMKLQYRPGTNGDLSRGQIRITYGGFVDETHFQDNWVPDAWFTAGTSPQAGYSIAATTQNCVGIQNDLAANAVYYLYYESLNRYLYASLTTPYEDAYPSAGQYYQASDGTCQYSFRGAAFVGSFLTDGNGYVIPFMRQDNDVLFVTPVSIPGIWTNGGIRNWTWRPFGAGAHSQIMSWNPIPTSASALILSVSGWSYDTTSPYTLFVLDSMGLGAPVQHGANWTFNTQAVFFYNQASANSLAGSFQMQDRQLRIKTDSSNNVTLWTQSAPAGQNVIDIDVGLMGYVEDIRAPNR
jgi:hypothetical protein